MADQPAVGDVIKDIVADIRTIVRGEIDLAKAEVVPGAKKAGLGVGLFVGAGVIGLLVINALFRCLGFAFSAIFWPHFQPVGAFALGFLCAAGVYLIIALIVALIGFKNVKKAKKPEAAIREAQTTKNSVEQAVNSGMTEAKMISTRGKKTIGRDAQGRITTMYSVPENEA